MPPGPQRIDAETLDLDRLAPAELARLVRGQAERIRQLEREVDALRAAAGETPAPGGAPGVWDEAAARCVHAQGAVGGGRSPSPSGRGGQGVRDLTTSRACLS